MTSRKAVVAPPSLGPGIVEWIEDHLVFGPGDQSGEPVVLDVEQCAFLHRAYELDLSGRRLIRRALLSRPKGAGKTEVAAAITVAELLGPARFDHWAEDGTPIGRPVKDALIKVCATEESQASNTYSAVKQMLEHLRETFPREFGRLDVGLTRTFTGDGGEVRPVTAAAASRDGGKESFVVLDESHLLHLPEHLEMAAVLQRNLAKRPQAEGWSLQTTTMFRAGQGSVAEATWEHSQKVRDGELKDRGLLVDHREGPLLDDTEWDDDEVMWAALAEAYGAAAPRIDVDRILAEVRNPAASRATSSRYFLNRSLAEESQWLMPAEWLPLAKRGPWPADGTPVALGFDGSTSDDATALVAVTMGPDPHVFVIGVWQAPEFAVGWQVPRDEVCRAVDDAFTRFKVSRLLADPPFWRSELSEWASLYDPLVVKPLKAAVVEFPCSSWTRFSKAVDRFETAVRAGQLTHDADPLFAQHVYNARVEATNPRRPELGRVITKDRKGSPRKIDLAVAAVLAFEARDGAIRDGWVEPQNVRPRIISLAAVVAAAQARGEW